MRGARLENPILLSLGLRLMGSLWSRAFRGKPMANMKVLHLRLGVRVRVRVADLIELAVMGRLKRK